MNDRVLVERRNEVLWLTLNRADKLNAIDTPMIEELTNALKAVESDDDTKVVVLAGSGNAFCAGHDLHEEAEHSHDTASSWRERLSADFNMTAALWSCQRPTIAAVDGQCLAAGCELAMACDMIVATPNSRFGEPEIRFGSGPVALLMPLMIGSKKASELLFTGDDIDAKEAFRIGLINRIIESEQLQDHVQKLAEKIALTPLEVLKLTKISLTRLHESMGVREGLAANVDISSILNSAMTPEQTQFYEITRSDGLKAALAWRDDRYRSLDV